MKTKIIRILTTLISALGLYYFILPPLNLSTSSFWFFLSLITIIYIITSVFRIQEILVNPKKSFKNMSVYFLIPIIIIVIFMINFILSPLFMAKSYYKRISVSNGDFITDIKEVNFKNLPLVDKDSSQKLGDRVMGQMPELVSQFYVSSLYTQINYKDEIIRVTPLEYNGLFKWLSNKHNGVMGYIKVNSVTGEATLVKLEKGMKYMPSAYFNYNLYRHLRFNYPTAIFGEANFEIDDNGNPYWIIPTLDYSGVDLKENVSGIIILDPITGETKRYKDSEVPEWVDHVYSSRLIIEQLNDWGKYKNGFFNSIFGQKDVVRTTTGYNYLSMNNDIYLYTGITSASSDESNVGFVLTNLRTKETKFYPVAGAEEYSAMGSAEGQVQQMKYSATFPLLINLNNKPTYLMSLKDNAGLVKMFAFVDVVDYQKVVVTDAVKGIEEASKNYLNNVFTKDNLTAKKIKVKFITSALIGGDTYYYILDENGDKYRVALKISEEILPFVNVGSELNINYQKADISEITSISK